MKNKPLILILSRNYSNGLAVARMLGAAGYIVDMIASSSKEGASDVARESKYIRNYREIVSKKVAVGGNEELIQAIMEFADKHDQKPILIPTDDYTTNAIDTNRDKLSQYFEMPHCEKKEQGEIAYLMNKSVQAEMAREVGLLVPKNWVVNLDQEIVVPDDMEYPCYVKPIKSILGYKTEMAICNNLSELQEHLELMKEKFSKRVVLVQEYLKKDTEITSAGLCLNQKIIWPGLIKRTRIGKYETGVTLTGELISLDALGTENVEKAKRLLQKLHYTGMFGMEFIVVGEKIYFNEVNLRSSGSAYAYCLNGANLAEMYVKGLQGERIVPDEEKMNEYGKTFIYDKVAWDDYVRGYITEDELKECINSTDFAILASDDDPAPGKLFVEKQLADKARRDKNKKLREDCLKTIIDNTGWTSETAEEHLDDARKRTGIKYRHYVRLKFWNVSVEEQEEKYQEYLDNRDKTIVLNPKKDNKLVVVLSRNYSTGLSIVRSLGAAGFTVDLVASVHKENNSEVTAASKYIRHYTEIISSKANELGKKLLKDELLKYRAVSEKPVLFPVDDYTVSVIDIFKDELEEIFILPSVNNGKSSLMEYMNKELQEKIAASAGMNVPKSWTIDLKEEIEIPEDIVYPCFCKPLESFSGSKGDMAKCNNEEELEIHLAALKTKESKRKIMIQEFLKIDDEIDFSGVCINDKVIIPAIIRKTRVAQHEKGVTLAGRIHPFEELDETLRNQIIAALQKYKYFGMFDMELNIVGEKIYFNEVNLRSGGPNYAYFKSGVNLPALFVKEAFGMGHVSSEENVKEYGKSFVYDKVAWEDYANWYISKRKLNKLLNEADFRLLDNPEDPKPGRIFHNNIQKVSRERRKKVLVSILRRSLRPYLGPVKRFIFRYPQTKRKNKRDPQGKKPRVMVVGRNYCSNLCMAKSLGEAGYDVEVLRVYQVEARLLNIMRNIKPDAFSKYVKAYYKCVTNRVPTALVKRLIEISDKKKKMLIIPADDLAADVIDEYMETLQDYYLLPSIKGIPGEVSKLMDKGYQKELAKEFGLPVVNSCVIKTYKGNFDIPDSINYPCFIKPNISKNASKKQICKCSNKTELRDALAEFSRRHDIEMIVEDFIEVGKEYSLLGLSTEEGAVGPGFFVAEQGGQEEHRGVALKGRIIEPGKYSKLVEQLITFVNTIGFNGLYDIDLVETTDGKMYFVELNMRYGASGYAVTKCGANLPAMFADYMFYRKPIDLNCKLDKVNKTFVSEKVVIDEYRMDRITWADVKRSMHSADYYFVKDPDDRRPYNHFKKRFLEARRLRNIDRKMQIDEE